MKILTNLFKTLRTAAVEVKDDTSSDLGKGSPPPSDDTGDEKDNDNNDGGE